MAALLCRNQQTYRTLSCSFCTYENYCSFQSLLTMRTTVPSRTTVNAAFREMADKLARLYPKKALHQDPRILGGWSEVDSPQPWGNPPQPELVLATRSGISNEDTLSLSLPSPPSSLETHVPMPLLTFTSAGLAIFTYFEEENETDNTESMPSLPAQNISHKTTAPVSYPHLRAHET